MKTIEKIEIIRKNKKRLYIIIKYNNGKDYIKKLNDFDKQSLFYALTDIQILNKYK